MLPGAGTDERRFWGAGSRPMKSSFGNFKVMIFVAVIFYSLAVIFWLISHSIFYLFNFGFIGTAAALGMGLWPVLAKDRKHIARKLSQALVGGYMFFGLGIGLVYIGFGRIEPENMQLAGFWFLLLGGSFAAAVMHYAIAKIAGPILFGRGWCGWACWTAAVLDCLPWRRSPGRLPKKFGAVKYFVFAVITAAVFVLVFAFGYTRHSIAGFVDLTGTRTGPGLSPSLFQIPEFWWFAIGNAVYYVAAIILAAVLKDNRAFFFSRPVPVFRSSRLKETQRPAPTASSVKKTARWTSRSRNSWRPGNGSLPANASSARRASPPARGGRSRSPSVSTAGLRTGSSRGSDKRQSTSRHGPYCGLNARRTAS
jgi:ferredoxin-type protein NapH